MNQLVSFTKLRQSCSFSYDGSASNLLDRASGKPAQLWSYGIPQDHWIEMASADRLMKTSKAADDRVSAASLSVRLCSSSLYLAWSYLDKFAGSLSDEDALKQLTPVIEDFVRESSPKAQPAEFLAINHDGSVSYTLNGSSDVTFYQASRTILFFQDGKQLFSHHFEPMLRVSGVPR